MTADQGQDDAADGGQQVRVGQGHPFEDVVVVPPAGAEEGRRVALRGDFLHVNRCGKETGSGKGGSTYGTEQWGCIRSAHGHPRLRKQALGPAGSAGAASHGSPCYPCLRRRCPTGGPALSRWLGWRLIEGWAE